MSFLVATNVVASRPPKRRPTGTPYARANTFSEFIVCSLTATKTEKASLKPQEVTRLLGELVWVTLRDVTAWVNRFFVKTVLKLLTHS